ncbi:MAG: NAD(P)-dependent oxidoreductase [Rhodospirillaceae bacterium]
MKTILITGAAGGVATFLRRELKGIYALKLADVVPVADLDEGETFVQFDITDLDAFVAAAAGCDGIVHLGGASDERAWDEILSANIVGCRNAYEAARLAGVKRVIFASSNHAVGFYRRDRKIGVDVTPRPDTRYGASKAFGESMGALYADKYGLEVTAIRIGNVDVRPADVRRLAIWVSPRDIAQLVRIGLDRPDIRFEIVYGVSGNTRTFWDNANAKRLGYKPADNSEDWAAEILANGERDTDNDLAETHQGGTFTYIEDRGGRVPDLS